MTGQTLALYQITSKLGQGGMGAVYRATDTKLDREVAIKVLPEEFAQHSERLARFEREAKALAKLNSPNIVWSYRIEQFVRFEVPYRRIDEVLATPVAGGLGSR